MKKKAVPPTLYTYAYWFYFFSSWCMLLGVIVFGWRCYLTDFREQVTISDLFLFILLFGFVAYLRMNAFHYQRILITSYRVKRKKQPIHHMREDDYFYRREGK